MLLFSRHHTFKKNKNENRNLRLMCRYINILLTSGTKKLNVYCSMSQTLFLLLYYKVQPPTVCLKINMNTNVSLYILEIPVYCMLCRTRPSWFLLVFGFRYLVFARKGRKSMKVNAGLEQFTFTVPTYCITISIIYCFSHPAIQINSDNYTFK